MITIAQFAWMNNLSCERVRSFCREGRIAGAQRVGLQWILPEDAVLPPRKAGRPPKGFGILPANAREIKTRKQKAFLESCKSPEENLAIASPFVGVTIEIAPW